MRRFSLSISLAALALCTACGAPEDPTEARAADALPSDPAARAAALLAEPDPLRRQARFASFLVETPVAERNAVFEAYAGSSLEAGDPEVVAMAAWWAAADPEAAFQWTQTDWRAMSGAVSAAVFRSWAQRDPEAAIRHAEALRFDVQRDNAVTAALVGWDESGQPGLEEHIQGLTDQVTQQTRAEVLARRRVAALGGEKAVAWADALPDPRFRRVMIPRVHSSLAVLDPAHAAKLAAPRITEGDARPSGLARRVGTRWARQDPLAALGWLETLPAGKDRDDGVMEAYRDWFRNDVTAALAWAEERPVERWAEPALSVYAKAISGRDPATTIEYVKSFSDVPLRERTVTIIARAWLERDYDAAHAHLETIELPEGVRKRSYMLRQDRFKKPPTDYTP
ncbi:MAG: hypothetical protein AAF430_25295 [Myxococcota bacterium]